MEWFESFGLPLEYQRRHPYYNPIRQLRSVTGLGKGKAGGITFVHQGILYCLGHPMNS